MNAARIVAAIAALLALTTAVPAQTAGGAGEEPGFGQYYQWNPATETWELHYGYHTARYQFGPGEAAPMEPGGVMQQTALRGAVVDVRAVELMPQRGAAAVATLRLPDGSSELVSLGRWEGFTRLGLRRGDEIAVRGRQGFVGSTPIFMATSMEAFGRRLAVSQPLEFSGPERGPRIERRSTAPTVQPARLRPGRQGGAFDWRGHEDERAFPAAFERHREGTARGAGLIEAPPAPRGGVAGEVGGLVQEMYYTNLPGVPEKEVLVRVRLSGDRDRYVNLGSELTPYQLEQIETARELGIRGRQFVIEGVPVVLADRISADGSTFGVRHRDAAGGRGP